MKFDVIVGNPPYATPSKRSCGKTIWQLHLQLSLQLTQKNGFICMVIPSRWRHGNFRRRSPINEIRNMLFDSESISIIDWWDCKEHFDISHSIEIDSLLLQKRECVDQIPPLCRKYCLLPRDKNKLSIVENYLKSMEKNSITLKYSRGKISNIQSPEYPHPVFTTSSKERRNSVQYSNKIPSDKNKLTVRVSYMGELHPHIICSSTGSAGHMGYYEIDSIEIGEKIVEYLNSKKFLEFYDQFRYEKSLFQPIFLINELPYE